MLNSKDYIQNNQYKYITFLINNFYHNLKST